MRKAGIRVLTWDEMDADARKFANDYYQREVDPLLTPITIDPAHPFPRVLNKAMCLALLLRRKRRGTAGPVLGVLTVPRALPRFVRIPRRQRRPRTTSFSHDLIERNAAGMYRGYEILSRAAFRVTRNSNLYFQEEESRSLLETVRAELHNRRKGDAVRLEIDSQADPEIVDRLRINFELEESLVYHHRRSGESVPRDESVQFLGARRSEIQTLRASRAAPQSQIRPIFSTKFATATSCCTIPTTPTTASSPSSKLRPQDPNVVSMKQTLYRTSADSPIFQALTEAAQTKEVTAVVELTARFDEASNIRWARNLEDAGVQVFHGIVGLKTHCKLALLVRRDPDGAVRRYAHLGTGNYNPDTARFYTDLSLLTADPEITAARPQRLQLPHRAF